MDRSHQDQPQHHRDDRPLSNEARRALAALQAGRLRHIRRGWLAQADDAEIISHRSIDSLEHRGFCAKYRDHGVLFVRLTYTGQLVVRGMEQQP